MDGRGVALALKCNKCLLIALLEAILSELAFSVSEEGQKDSETVGSRFSYRCLIVAGSIEDIFVVFLDELVKSNDGSRFAELAQHEHRL